MLHIKEISPLQNDVQVLFQLLDQHNSSYLPPDVCHLTQPDELAGQNSVLVGAYLDNQIVGMGGLIFFKEYAEVTRLYVKDEFKGRCIAKEIMYTLETIAVKKDLKHLKLETSHFFKEAVNLYNKLGFTECAPFGKYICQPKNSYYEKEIQPSK